jgi:DNA polymerase II small subunit/DNA polymerase delta subunit B
MTEAATAMQEAAKNGIENLADNWQNSEFSNGLDLDPSMMSSDNNAREAQQFQNYVQRGDSFGVNATSYGDSVNPALNPAIGALGEAQSVVDKLQLDSSKQGNPAYAKKLSDLVSVVKDRMERVSAVVEELAKKSLSQQDLMRIQYEVMQMGIVLDVASKVGDKGSRALQTLFRDK